MRSRIDFIAERVESNLEESGTDVVVNWNEWPANAALDPVTQARTGTPTARTETLRAFLHFIQPSASVIRQFDEIETGDCLLEYSPEVTLEGRDSLRFIIEGVEWSAKPMSQHLRETWDAVFAGRRLFKTLLLKRSTG